MQKWLEAPQSALPDAQVELLSCREGRALLRVTIHEGKNRQIRRMCRQVGLRVHRLQRVQEHTLCLGALKPGKWRYLTDVELQEIRGSDLREQ